MQTAIRMQATVLPGNRLEIIAPELPEGQIVEVIVLLPVAAAKPRQSALDFIESLPPGPRCYPTWEETERAFQEERNSWDR